jgi:hypothetical protein
MVAVGESVYVLGGYDDNNDDEYRTLMSIEQYGITTGSWEDASYLAVPVRSASAAVDREKIYLFGGVTSADFDTKVVQCFDTRLKTCTIVCELPVYCRVSQVTSDHNEPICFAYLCNITSNSFLHCHRKYILRFHMRKWRILLLDRTALKLRKTCNWLWWTFTDYW